MTRLERLFENLPEDVDSVLITSDINRRYFSGMKSSAGTVIAFREKAYLVIDFRYIEKARKTVKNLEVIEQKNLVSQISELLKKHNALNIAIESKTMTVSELAVWKSKLSKVSIIDTDMLSNEIEHLRAVKDDSELECIRKAQEIAEKAFEKIIGFIRPDVTERQVALELNRIMFEEGAEDISFDTIVLSGKNTSMPHGVPSGKKIQNGEFVLMDFGAVYNGYHSDMTRTVCVGEPSPEMRKVYDIVLKAQLSALDYAKAGITGSQLDSVARKIISDAGYGECFGHALGHSVGLEIHEFPVSSPNSNTVLRAGNIMTIEPGIYIEGKFGVRIEDFVILNENSCENLTKCAKNIIISK
ncbi:MAG: aminopeptidase P family protein [Oscillospiraceae bacterium]|nr:aminopeptidase P family protein [Oscillospiraceae bacterium]